MQVSQPSDVQVELAAELTTLGGGMSGAEIRAEFAAGRMRREWSVVATDDGGTVIGRAMWWGRDARAPIALDVWDVHPRAAERPVIAAALLEHGHTNLAREGVATPLPHTVRVPTSWRAQPDLVAEVELKTRGAAVAGLTRANERWQYQWDAGRPLPPEPAGLVFEPADDAAFVEVIAQAAAGSLDVMTQRELASVPARELALAEIDYYRSCPGERSWWRLARDTEGAIVGLAIPSATPTSRNVGYLAVLPAHRGKGYVDRLLAYITRFHAEQGAPRITATTDAVNAPMAAAFERAGYSRTETRIDLEAP